MATCIEGGVVLIAGKIVIEVPADQIVHIAIGVVIHTIQVTGIKSPGAACPVDGVSVAVGILAKVVPDVWCQFSVFPVHAGIHHRQNSGFGTVLAFMDAPRGIGLHHIQIVHAGIIGVVRYVQGVVKTISAPPKGLLRCGSVNCRCRWDRSLGGS